jgi:hypothetical protein
MSETPAPLRTQFILIRIAARKECGMSGRDFAEYGFIGMIDTIIPIIGGS